MWAAGLQPTASHLIVGQSCSGKTQYLFRFLRHLDELYPETKFKDIVWCYGHSGSLKDIPKDIRKKITKFQEGFPKKFENLETPAIVILDDLFSDLFQSKDFLNLLTRGVHHTGLTLLCTAQAATLAEKYTRACLANFQYLTLFWSWRDRNLFSHIARQIAGSEWRNLLQSFECLSATECWPYLFADLHPQSTAPDWARIRSNIFPSDNFQIILVPRHFANVIPYSSDNYGPVS